MMFGKFIAILACTTIAFACANKKKTETASASNPAPAATAAQSPSAATAQAQAEIEKKPESPKKTEALICKRAEENRSLEIEESQPQGCRLWYTRNGTRSSVASSVKATTHCNQVRNRIRTNLENADFKCTSGAVSQNVVPPSGSAVNSSLANQKK